MNGDVCMACAALFTALRLVANADSERDVRSANYKGGQRTRFCEQSQAYVVLPSYLV